MTKSQTDIFEAGGRLRVGRFGWKNQHASLVSFSGDAYLNEIGITNFLVRDENTSLGRFVGFGTIFDVVPDNTPCTGAQPVRGIDPDSEDAADLVPRIVVDGAAGGHGGPPLQL